MALPVAAGQRAPAADRRPADGQRRAAARQPLLPPAEPGMAFMPIEFGAAAYRFGHSMVRPSYRANFTSGTGDSTDPDRQPVLRARLRPQRAGLLSVRSPTTATTSSAATPPRGATSAGRRSSTSATARSRTTRRSTPRSRACCSPSRCPAIAPHTQTARPSCRNATCCASSPGACPPGRRSPARCARRPCLEHPTCRTSPRSTPRSPRSTPLWYYILAEAKALAGGLHLGPVGGRIVTETLIGLLRADPTSYLERLPALPAVPRHRPQARPDAQPEHHRQPHLHPRALPPLRPRRHPRHLPMITQLLTPTHLATLLIVLLLYFGPRRLPQAGRALGRSIREFTEAATGHDGVPKDELPCSARDGGEHKPVRTTGSE